MGSLAAISTIRKPADAVRLHPGLWLGHQLGRPADHTVPTGFPVLDAELPGGGWPCRGLTELLLPHWGMGEIRLLAPSLVAVQQAGRLVMLFDPPAELSACAWSQLGLDVPALLMIQTQSCPAADAAPGMPANTASKRNSLWALEQALKSGHVGAVIAWLPSLLRAEYLRRLQLAASVHDGPAFMLRAWPGQSALADPTPAPLRLGLQMEPTAQGVVDGALGRAQPPGASDAPHGAEQLAIHLLKRRGPPRSSPLRVTLPSVIPDGHPAARSPAAEPKPAATFIDLA